MAKLFGKKEEDLNKKRLKEVVPVAKQLIKLIADAGLEIGEVHAHNNDKYNAIAKEVLQSLLDNNIKYVDKDFVFQLILQPFDQIREIVSMSLKESFDTAMNKAFGVEFREIRLSDVDKKIRGE